MEEESEVDEEEEEEEVVYRCLVSCGNARLRARCCCRKLSMQSRQQVARCTQDIQ